MNLIDKKAVIICLLGCVVFSTRYIMFCWAPHVFWLWYLDLNSEHTAFPIDMPQLFPGDSCHFWQQTYTDQALWYQSHTPPELNYQSIFSAIHTHQLCNPSSLKYCCITIPLFKNLFGVISFESLENIPIFLLNVHMLYCSYLQHTFSGSNLMNIYSTIVYGFSS